MICIRCHTEISGYSEPWSYPPDGRRICRACAETLTSDVLTLLAAARPAEEEEREEEESPCA